MKKDQTRNMGYPMFPTYPGINPNMMGPMPYGLPGVNMNQAGMIQSGNTCSNNSSNEISNLQNKKKKKIFS